MSLQVLPSGQFVIKNSLDILPYYMGCKVQVKKGYECYMIINEILTPSFFTAGDCLSSKKYVEFELKEMLENTK